MMTLNELWKHFKWLSDFESYTKEEQEFLMRFLSEEYRLREQKRREQLFRMSGTKRVKLLADFDWTFNPKVSRSLSDLTKERVKVLSGVLGVKTTVRLGSICNVVCPCGCGAIFPCFSSNLPSYKIVSLPSGLSRQYMQPFQIPCNAYQFPFACHQC